VRQQIAVFLLVGACTLAVGCIHNVSGKAVPADRSGPYVLPPLPVSTLDGLLLNVEQINTALGATTMKTWFDARKMWDWSAHVDDRNCLGVDGPAQDKVYANTGWTGMRGQRLDDSTDGSKRRNHYAIQAVVAFPSARDAAAFYKSSTQRWPVCSNRRFSDRNPGAPDTVWTVAEVTNEDGTLSTTETQEGGNGWTCQRALTIRNNVAIDIVACSTAPGSAAKDIAIQIAAKVD
jgi:PknH-like extracellular domain